MLNVLQVLPALEMGGVEKGTLEIAAALVRKGHKSFVVSGGGKMVPQLEESGSVHIYLPVGKKSPLSLLLIRRLRKIILENKINILHARSRMPAWIGYFALGGIETSCRPHFITTVHGAYNVNRYSAIMTKGDQVIAISEFIRNYIIENYPDVSPQKINLIHRGIDPAIYPSNYIPPSEWLITWYQQYPQFKDKFIVTLPGRITRRKGHEDFLQIINNLSSAGISVHGIVAGGYHKRKKSYFNFLLKHTASLGLQSYVTFIGHRDDLRNVMSVSNVVASLSIEPEAFGRTALEALSMKVPVVAYDHGGASEVLNAIYPSGLVERGNIKEVTKKIIDIYNSEKQNIPDNTFTLEKMLSRTISLYEEVYDTGLYTMPA